MSEVVGFAQRYFYLEPSTQFGQLVGARWNEVNKMKNKIPGTVYVEKLVLVNWVPEDANEVELCGRHCWGDAFMGLGNWHFDEYGNQDRCWLLWKNLQRSGKDWAEKNAFQYAIQVTAERDEDACEMVFWLREREDYLHRRGIAHITKEGDMRGRYNRQNNARQTGWQGPKESAIGPNEVERTDIVNTSVEQGSLVAQPKSRPPAPMSPPPKGYTIPEYQPKETLVDMPESKAVRNWASVEVDDETEEKVSGSKRRGSVPDVSELPEMPGYGGPSAIKRDISADEGYATGEGYEGFDSSMMPPVVATSANDNKAGGLSTLSIHAKDFVPSMSLSSVSTVSTTCSVGYGQAGAQVTYPMTAMPVSYYAQPQSLYIPSGQYGCVADYGQPLTQQAMFHSQGNNYRTSLTIY